MPAACRTRMGFLIWWYPTCYCPGVMSTKYWVRFPGYCAQVARWCSPHWGPIPCARRDVAWDHADTFAHVHDFTDMHDLGDALIRHDFVEPVMDVQILGLTFSDIQGTGQGLYALWVAPTL